VSVSLVTNDYYHHRREVLEVRRQPEHIPSRAQRGAYHQSSSTLTQKEVIAALRARPYRLTALSELAFDLGVSGAALAVVWAQLLADQVVVVEDRMNGLGPGLMLREFASQKKRRTDASVENEREWVTLKKRLRALVKCLCGITDASAVGFVVRTEAHSYEEISPEQICHPKSPLHERICKQCHRVFDRDGMVLETEHRVRWLGAA
jgi:hypothetical protein